MDFGLSETKISSIRNPQSEIPNPMPSIEPRRVLKANSVRNLGSKIAFNYEDFRRKCDEHLEKVRLQTRQMLERAQKDSESIRAQAFEEGRESGFQLGRQTATEEIEKQAADLADQMTIEKLKTTLPAMQAAADALSQERDRWLAAWEAAAVRLSVAIAEKLVRHELHIKPQTATGMFVEALQLAAGNAHIRLRMHPDDAQLLGDHPEEVLRSIASCGGATLVPDETISRGGCIIETQHGVIDARVETQLQRITSELLQGD